MTGSCCVLEETAPSLNTPLGYIVYTLPGTDSGLPFPCVRIIFPADALSRNNYLVVVVSPTSSIMGTLGARIRLFSFGGQLELWEVDFTTGTFTFK